MDEFGKEWMVGDRWPQAYVDPASVSDPKVDFDEIHVAMKAKWLWSDYWVLFFVKWRWYSNLSIGEGIPADAMKIARL